MFIVLGATGHVGSATAETLLKQGQAVTVVTRAADRAEALRKQGAEIAVADVHDVEAMRNVFRFGKRLFLLNPPAMPDTDTDRTEKETARCLLDALDGSGLEKVVAESTYGAQPGNALGDLNTLYELEQGLATQPIPFSVIRAAYYMSNWDMLVTSARENGVLPTMYPAGLEIPMVAPAERTGIHCVEGPERYSSTDVANAFADALGRIVTPAVTPRDQWEPTYRKLGFSEPAARSYSRMTGISVDGDFEMPDDPIRGGVTLNAYIADLCARA